MSVQQWLLSNSDIIIEKRIITEQIYSLPGTILTEFNQFFNMYCGSYRL